MSVSIHRLRRPVRANKFVGEPLSLSERALMMASAEQKIAELFEVLQIDHRNDDHTRETPRRVAKMFIEEMMQGRYSDPPILTEFENAKAYDELIVTGPIEVRSHCAHHLLPIYGEAFIGVLPARDGRIIGLSKYDRVVHHFAARLQVQEEPRPADQGLHRRTHCAARPGGAHLCRSHVQDASRRSRQSSQPHGHGQLFR